MLCEKKILFFTGWQNHKKTIEMCKRERSWITREGGGGGEKN